VFVRLLFVWSGCARGFGELVSFLLGFKPRERLLLLLAGHVCDVETGVKLKSSCERSRWEEWFVIKVSIGSQARS